MRTKSKTPQTAQRQTAPETLDREWGTFLDKVIQSALLLVVVKLVSAWVCAGLWSVPIRSRFIWGFVPYAGVQTSGAQFRTLAAWSTAITAIVAVIWAATHFFPKRTSSGHMWGGFAALPMSVLLAGLEWYRKFDADHLLPGQWLMWIMIGVLAPTVLILGFVERADEEAAVLSKPAPVGAPRPSAQRPGNQRPGTRRPDAPRRGAPERVATATPSARPLVPSL